MSELMKLVQAIQEKVAKLEKGKDVADNKALIASMVADALKQQPKIVRKSLFDLPAMDIGGRFATLRKRIAEPAMNDFDREMQALNDDMYVASVVLKKHPTELKMWQEFQAGGSTLKKALDTATASEGLEWIPTGFSAALIDLVRVQLKVSALFRRFTMPTNPYKFPVVSSDMTGYLQSESIVDEAQKLRASTAGTTNLELSAVKLAARALFSEEISEDSVVPILSWIKDQIALALATAEEKALINGDTTATHQDSNVTAAYDAQKAWNGLRKLVVSAAKVDIATLNIENIRSIRKAMGKYGVDPAKLAYICSINGYIQLLSLKDSNSVQVVTTVDKYGANATILSGELGKLDGSPIIVSEWVYNNLNGSGVYDGVTTTKTAIVVPYIPAFIIGDRRRVTVKTAQDIETDQQIVVATQRLDFHPFFATTEKMVGLGYNLTA
uniref:Putative capsid protein n=1 Tax=viral metagenome TaxID=1070528 RepID=A0A6M3KWW7_9ZZZZ